MKSLVVYDSWYGNTQKIAQAIASGLGDGAQTIKANGNTDPYLKDCELLVVGSPTHGGTVTPMTHEFLNRLAPDDIARIPVAAFDTRAKGMWLRVVGFAAQRIARLLQAKGGVLVGIPEGFYVKGNQGPLLEGEESRATEWAATIALEVEEMSAAKAV